MRERRSTRIAGIDPAAGRSPTGLVVLEPDGSLMLAALLEPGAAPEHIAVILADSRVGLAAIDAPLRPAPGLRSAEKLLSRCTEVSMLPQSMPGMRKLAETGRALREALVSAGVAVVETYPAAAARVLGVERPRGRGRHLADALLAALAGLAFSRGEALGSQEGPDLIVVPAPLEAYRGLYRGLLPLVLRAGCQAV